ncbi:MAG: hypothetical protein ACPMAQ_06015 [Phycisphaerae bacterium]
MPIPKLSLRRYDVQARVSVVLSAAALVCVAGLAVLVFQHLVIREKVIPYNPKSLRMPLVYVSGLLALGLGIAGFGLGLNSAGQRRNDKPVHSWIGFFLGAGAITLSIILLFLFKSWGDPIIVQ